MTIMTTTYYGFTTPDADIERVLGIEPDSLARTGFDLDLADDCRTLRADGIDLNDACAVREWAQRRPARYADALVLAAASFFVETEIEK